MSSYTIPSVVSQSPRGDRIMDVYSHLLTERIVYLGTAIDAGVANALIAQLLHLEADSQGREINLYINCEGGDLAAMLAIYDTMQFVTSPVATTCVGEAVGAGATLLAGGAAGRRSALPHARILLHQPAGQGRGTIPDLILQADDLRHMRDTVLGLVADDTGQPIERVFEDSLHDRWFTAQQAKEYGFIDRVVDSFDQVMPARRLPIGMNA